MAKQARAGIFFSGEVVKRCPRVGCVNHRPRAEALAFRRRGFFVTRWNSQPVRRYQCKACQRTFSSHTFRPHYRQHRPDLNDRVFQLYVSGMTQRRMAEVLRVNRKTIVRKFLFLSDLVRDYHEQQVACGRLATGHVQLDEMESFEHTKLKPITIALAVRARTAEIIDVKTAPIAYKGPLAALAFRKYGPRPHESGKALSAVLRSVRACAKPQLLITTDYHPAYPKHIRNVLPTAIHHQALRVLKEKTDRKNKDDALFTLNFTAAKIRNDLSRLARRTWVTTKRIPRLQRHLNLYIAWNNRYRIPH